MPTSERATSSVRALGYGGGLTTLMTTTVATTASTTTGHKISPARAWPQVGGK